MNSPEAEKLIFKQLVLHTNPDGIHQVEGVIEEIRSDLNVKEDVYGNMMVAVTEGVNNAILHGNKNDASKKVFVDFEMKHEFRLIVRIRDEGEGFDPDNLADPTAPENLENIGGRGVFLMRHLSDEISFQQDGRQVEMIFNI